MKKTTFAGVTVSLVIGAFYTFMFCMIGNTADDISGLSSYTMDYTQTVSDSSDTEYIISNETEDFEIKLSDIDVKAQATETINIITLPETAEELKVTETQTQVTNPTSEAKASETTSEVSVKVTTAAEATTAEVTMALATAATTFEDTLITEQVKPETSPKEDDENTSDDLPDSGNINDGQKLSYTYNGVKHTDNAYDTICRIVSAEISANFDEEAIKAQAVATYSFLKYHNKRGESPSVVMKNSVPTKIKNAVKEVYGIAVYYNNQIAQTVYCASTGGSSVSAKYVWGNDIPYLRAVECEYDVFDPNYGKTVTFTSSEVKSMVENTTGISLLGDPNNWFTFLSASEGGILDGNYNGNMLIGGESYYTKNGARINITGRTLRENIFNYKLYSAKFDINYSDGVFTFTTYGYGHGVGMSQNGADLFAKYADYSYMDILNHYYKNVTIR